MGQENLRDETTFSRIYFDETDDLLVLGVIAKNRTAVKLSVIFCSIIPIMNFALLIADMSILSALYRNIILFLVLFVPSLLLVREFRKHQEGNLIRINKTQNRIDYKESSIFIEPTTKITIMQYTSRFNNQLVQGNIKTGDTPLDLGGHRLMIPILKYMASRFSIDLTILIDDSIPYFAKSTYPSRMLVEGRSLGENILKISLIRKPEPKYLSLPAIILPPVIVMGIFLWSYFQDHIPQLITYIVIIVGFMSLGSWYTNKSNREYNSDHITNLLIDTQKRVLTINNDSHVIPKNAVLQQIEVTVYSRSCIDSMITWYGNTVMLPFMANKTQTREMNEKVAKALNIELRAIN